MRCLNCTCAYPICAGQVDPSLCVLPRPERDRLSKYHSSLAGYPGSVVQQPVRPPSALITGGLGDFLAIESHLPDVERRRVKHLVFATRAHHPIRHLVDHCLPGCTCEALWEDFSRFPSFYHAGEVERATGLRLVQADDWSISRVFPLIESGVWRYRGSSLLGKTLADLRDFRLPSRYVVLCPSTTADAFHPRHLDHAEIEWALSFALKRHAAVVALDDTRRELPAVGRLINLTGQTTILQSIEILKHGCGFVGVDSALSVLSAQVFVGSDIAVKSVNPHLTRWSSVYYRPHSPATFFRPRLDIEPPKRCCGR